MTTLVSPQTASYTTFAPQEFVTVACTGPNDEMIVTWTGPAGTSGQRTVKNTLAAGELVGPFLPATTVKFNSRRGSPSYSIFGGSSSSSLRPYLGQVATGCRTPDIRIPQANIMARSRHIMRGDTGAIQLLYANWYTAATGGNGVEAGVGNDITYTAAVEYPPGVTLTQVTWGGATSQLIPTLTNGALSDPVGVQIPDGAEFFVRTFVSGTAVLAENPTAAVGGFPIVAARDAANGEYLAANSTDQTMSLSNSWNDVAALHRLSPYLIVGKTTRPSVLILGTSLDRGIEDAPIGTSGDRGLLARAIGASLAYANFAQGSSTALQFITGANSANRRLLGKYFSHLNMGHGRNDLATAATVAQTVARIRQAISMPGLENLVASCNTCMPTTTSTDLWATVAGQTVNGSASALVPSFNEAIRAGIPGFANYFDPANVVMTSLNSNIFVANGSSYGFTPDGVHTTNTANIAVQNAGVVTPYSFA